MQGASWEKAGNGCKMNPGWNTRFKTCVFADDLSGSLRQIFQDAEACLAQAVMVKNSRSTPAGIFVAEGQKFFIKRSNVNSLPERLRRIGRISRAMRNWQMAAELSAIGIRTPRVYMALSTYPWLLPGASYLIIECLPESITAQDYLQELFLEPGQLEGAVAKITAMLYRMHNHGIEHGDLKLSNILAWPDAGGMFHFGVFDLDGSVKHRQGCSHAVRCGELARAASSCIICLETLTGKVMAPAQRQAIIAAWAHGYNLAGGADYTQDKDYCRKLKKFIS